MQGTQTQGAYIPEQSTDFIFSVIGEELDFLGRFWYSRSSQFCLSGLFSWLRR